MPEQTPRVGPSRAAVQAKKRGRPAKKSEEALAAEAAKLAGDVGIPQPDAPRTEAEKKDGGVRLKFERIKAKKGIHFCDKRPDGTIWGGKITNGKVGVFYDPACIATLMKAGGEQAPGPTHSIIKPEQQIEMFQQFDPATRK